MTDMDEFTLTDGPGGAVNFRGTLLAEHSSFTPSKDRWTETKIYITEAGSYVLHKVGRTKLPNEEDRFSAQISEKPQGLIECFYFKDPDGVWTMRYTDRMCLYKAMDKDEALRLAFKKGVTIE